MGEEMDKEDGLYVEYNICTNNIIKQNTIYLGDGKYINILLTLVVFFIFIMVLIILFLLHILNIKS